MIEQNLWLWEMIFQFRDHQRQNRDTLVLLEDLDLGVRFQFVKHKQWNLLPY